MIICFSHSFQRRFLDNVGKVDGIFPVFRFAEFIDEELDCGCGGADKTDTFQMPHSFARRVFKTTTKSKSEDKRGEGVLDEVDFMVEEGGLRRCNGYNGSLAISTN